MYYCFIGRLLRTSLATYNIGLPQAGLPMELHTVLLSNYICAWRQVVAFNSRLRQAIYRYLFINSPQSHIF